MGKFVEIGALVEKKIGDEAYEKIYNLEGVEYVFLETGRSNDLFKSRQFGEFGEAALMTIIAESAKKDLLFGVERVDDDVLQARC